MPRLPTAARGQGHLLQGCRNQRSGSSVGILSLKYASNIEVGNDIASSVLLVPSGKTKPKGRRGIVGHRGASQSPKESSQRDKLKTD